MKNRRGFTLIELLVVIGIMLVLMGVLLPVLTKTRRLANIKATQLDFQMIASALDAYKAAYGTYPRNSSLPGWNGILPAMPPQFMSLAIALIGPGPLYSSSVNGQAQVGDGVTGFGSRVTCANNSTALASAASPGNNSITVYSIGAISAGSVGPNTIFVSINDLTNGSEDELGVSSITGSPGSYTINFDPNAVNNVLKYTHLANAPVDIKIPAGIPQPLFLPADKFKILWNVIGENGINENGQPLLLDRWGGPIQYFTRFGPNSNRMVINGVANPYTPSTAPVLPVTAGPLYGVSAPWTINTTTPGIYSIYDQEDGTLTAHEALAFQWMLGDDNLNNLIDNGETLRYTGDYVLISAGPDTDPSTTSLPTNLPISKFVDFSTLTPSQYQLAFKNSGNVYNFER